MSEEMMRAGKSRLSVIAVIICLLVIVNSVLYRMQGDISMCLGGGSVDESALEYDSAACFEEGTSVAAAIQEEGSVLLQNENSASASEIFAGAIQDFGAGKIVGTQSFGKGIVQSIIPLSDGSAVKLTVEKYYTPKGVNIHGKGITPDVKVEISKDGKKDNQLQKAIEVIEKEK